MKKENAMKRHTMILKALTIMCMFTATALLFSPSRTPGAASAKAERVKGKPVVVRDGEKSVLKNGATVNEGDEISTGQGDSLNVKFGTGDVLIIGTLTRLKIAKQTDDGGVSIDHKEGFTWAKVKKISSGKRFQISTPTAVAGVRGTGFSSVVESKEKSWFCVCEGGIDVSASGREVRANRGQSVSVGASGGPGKPRPDKRLLEKPTRFTKNCFNCHQGGHAREDMY